MPRREWVKHTHSASQCPRRGVLFWIHGVAKFVPWKQHNPSLRQNKPRPRGCSSSRSCGHNHSLVLIIALATFLSTMIGERSHSIKDKLPTHVLGFPAGGCKVSLARPPLAGRWIRVRSDRSVHPFHSIHSIPFHSPPPPPLGAGSLSASTVSWMGFAIGSIAFQVSSTVSAVKFAVAVLTFYFPGSINAVRILFWQKRRLFLAAFARRFSFFT